MEVCECEKPTDSCPRTPLLFIESTNLKLSRILYMCARRCHAPYHACIVFAIVPCAPLLRASACYESRLRPKRLCDAYKHRGYVQEIGYSSAWTTYKTHISGKDRAITQKINRVAYKRKVYKRRNGLFRQLNYLQF